MPNGEGATNTSTGELDISKRPSSQENFERVHSREKLQARESSSKIKTTGRGKVSDKLLVTEIRSSHEPVTLLPAASPISHKHMTPQVLKGHMSTEPDFKGGASYDHRASLQRMQKSDAGKYASTTAGEPGQAASGTQNSILPEVQLNPSKTMQSTANPSMHNSH